MSDFEAACDEVLRSVTEDFLRVPGVVAMVTTRDGPIYSGAFGERRLGGEAMTEDTVFNLFSATQAITATAALQCVEEGLLLLDAPARDYLPEIGTLQVLEAIEADGTPRLRAPNSDLTTRQLLLHTAGFGYEFFSEDYHRLVQSGHVPSVASGHRAALNAPLLADPGTRWIYGIGLDWVGLIVEAIRGKRLGQVLREHIFDPLGMRDTGFTRSPEMAARSAAFHRRDAEGALIATGEWVLPDLPETDMGGHGLFGTVPDYMQFIRMWLNDGRGPNGPVLRPETVGWAVRNGLQRELDVHRLHSAEPAISCDVELFPGLKKGWAYPFMINLSRAPTGRATGSLGWAGVANSFYWIDRKTGIGGYWATQILPFGDPVSYIGSQDFEATVYHAFRRMNEPVPEPVRFRVI